MPGPTGVAGGAARPRPRPPRGGAARRARRGSGTARRARRLLGATEPEGLTVAGSFGSRRAGGPSGSVVPGLSWAAMTDASPEPLPIASTRRSPAIEARRRRTVEVAMRHFAERGYRAGRVEDIATEVGVAKGTVFLDFGTKEGLFFAAYREAVAMLPAWLDAPPEVVGQG